MLNFREFQAGPDPFGRKYTVLLKWMQNAITLRHSDTVDVKFILVDEQGARIERTIALPHADLRRLSGETGRPLDDPWCARLAQCHLLHLVETGEDIEKDLVTTAYGDLQRYAAEVAGQERSETAAG
jgi:hypothetical protein